MNSKTILKRTLPIIIALVVILVIALVSTLATKAKKVPGLKEVDKNGAYVTYTLADGSKITVTNQMVYETLTGSSTAANATVSELVDIMDKDLLSDYVAAAKDEDVNNKVAKSLFGKEFAEYLEANEKDNKLAAKKDGITYEEYTDKQIEKAIDDFVTKLKVSYGINANKANFTYKDSSNKYAFSVDKTSGVYAYYVISVARDDYANKCIKEEYADALAKYNYYLKCVESYKKYNSAVEDYEEDLADWKNTPKKDRGEKPVEPNKKDYYVTDETFGTYNLKKAPEEVEAPVLVEDDVKKAYNKEVFDNFWAVLIPYATKEAAETALLQSGVVIAENSKGDYTWFKYGKTDFSGDPAKQAELEEKYTLKGKTTIITDNDYYETVPEGEMDPATGAVELTEAQIKTLMITLYNQFYQAYADKQLVAGTDYNASTFEFTEAGKEKIKFSQSDLSTLGIYSTASTNKFYKFKAEGENAFRDTYTYTIQSGSSVYCLYLIVAKEDTADWDEYLEKADCKYYETQYYKDNLDELLEGKVTTAYVNKKVAALRVEADLLIYDAKLEESYMGTYTSDYKATKKSSGTNLISYKVNGKTKTITVDEIFAIVADKYGAVSAIDKYQYEWMLLEAKNSKGELVNKYVDYKAYKNGKSLAKCIMDNDEAKKLYKTVETYVENTKNNFSAGNYAESGYPASVGWNNFLATYFLENYGVKVTSSEELKLFYMYQQVVADYCEDIATVSKDLYETVYYTFMAKKLANTLNTTGVHFLISFTDAEGEMVDPYDWTADQETLAKSLYDEVLELVKVVPTSDVTTVLSDLANALNDSPLKLDGSEPNITYTTSTVGGGSYTYNYLTYDYTYYPKGADGASKYVINVAKYKSAGIKATSESLTVTEGKMVPTFEEAVRQIWNKQLKSLAKGEAVEDVVVYDKTFTAPEYANNGNYLATQYGYHVYINLTSSLSSYFTTNADDNKVFVAFPEYDHVLMYLYEQTQSAKDDFKKWDDMYEDLEDAVKEKDEIATKKAQDTLVEYAKKAGLTVSTWADFENTAKKYCAKDYKAYTAKQLSTWFTTYSNSAYTLAYADFTSSAYYQLNVMQNVLNSLSKFTFAGNGQAKFEETVQYYIENYTKSLTSVSFMYKDAESVEELLKALNALDLDAFAACDKLFTNGDKCDYTAEQAKLTEVFNAFKAYTKAAYEGLTAEEQADLAELAKVLK